METIKKLLAELLAKLMFFSENYNPPDYIPSEIPSEPKPEPKYKWGTIGQRIISARTIMDEEGLIKPQKDLLCSVIEAESGWRLDAVNKNKDGSADYGIIQANSYWYIERGQLLTKEEALFDPEKCVRVMISQYKKGFLSDWWAFRNGSYRKHLARYENGSYKNIA